jgi:hypothetical protein
MIVNGRAVVQYYNGDAISEHVIGCVVGIDRESTIREHWKKWFPGYQIKSIDIDVNNGGGMGGYWFIPVIKFRMKQYRARFRFVQSLKFTFERERFSEGDVIKLRFFNIIAVVMIDRIKA